MGVICSCCPKKEVTSDTYKGKTNNLQEELSRLKSEYKDKYRELYDRKWMNTLPSENNTNEQKSQNNDNSLQFSIFQFNVLADGLSGAHGTRKGRGGFDKSPVESLDFKYRGFRILEEIINASPDIITMQEADAFDFLAYYLEPYGYSGHFQPKAKSPCTYVGNENNIKLLSDVAMLIHFKFIRHDKEFLVGTTHLKATKDHGGEQRRLNQLNVLLSTWLDIKEKSNNIDLFIGCDLNSPHTNVCGFPPMAYRSIVNGNAFIEKYVQSNEQKKIDVPKDYVSGYGLNLSSAYCVGLGAEPLFTTYKSRGTIACHTIDYIFYEAQKWNVSQVLSIPTDEEVKSRKTYLPAWDYPSDHFAIGAVFSI
eukprot:1029584_1